MGKEMNELEQAREELLKLKDAIFRKCMSDDYCYTNGTIYPLLHEEKELRARIAELEKVNE
jgi:hypothetical protein